MIFSGVKKYFFLFLFLSPSWLLANLLHSVVEGDTLESVSKKYGVKVERLRTVNKLTLDAELQIGETLVIPRAYDPVVVQPWAEDPLPVTESVSLANNSFQNPDVQSQTEELENNNQEITIQELNYEKLQETAYQIEAGDTLISLANRYGTEPNVLKNINQLTDDSLRVGQSLLLPQELEQNVFYSYRMGITETLADVAALFKTSVEQLQRLNNIKPSETSFATERVIYLNQVEQKDENISFYTVKQGDTLWSIARQFGVSVAQIQQANNNLDRVLSVGQQLSIPQTTPNDGKFYTIQAGDTAWSLAREYGVSVTELLEINQIEASTLRVGRQLMIPEKTATAALEQTSVEEENKTDKGDYIVAPGDTFWSIAHRFNIDVSKLKLTNQSENNFLTVGQKLVLPQTEVAVSFSTTETEEQITEPLVAEDASSSSQQEEEIKQDEEVLPEEPAQVEQETSIAYRPPEKIDAWKEFFNSALPAYNFQPSSNYFEDFANDPLKTYRKAKLLLDDFDQKIAQLPQKSQALKGYYFVIDPGHGGLDPGFVGVSEDGDGKKLYIIEDEYNYDLALRLYRELKLHGAKVTLTVISPNHQLINDYNPLHTFVSQKNEVYNSPFLNHSGDGSSWPIGNKEGLRKRRIIAERFFLGVPEDKRIFLSIHNDNTPEFGDGRLLLYYDDGLISSIPAANFARKLIPYLGTGAHYRGQNLGVLRDNPAGMALLLEMRNIAYQRNSWAIRYLELRQKDAELVAQALVEVLG